MGFPSLMIEDINQQKEIILDAKKRMEKPIGFLHNLPEKKVEAGFAVLHTTPV